MEEDLYNSTENYIVSEIQKKTRKSDKYYEVLKDPLYSELCRIRNDRKKLVTEQEALLKKLTDTEMPTKSVDFSSDEMYFDFMDVGMEIEVTSNEEKVVEDEGIFMKEMKNAEKSENSASKHQRKRERMDEKENDFESFFISISERTKRSKRSCRK
ncbi:uncharacterized protein [Parasteatoda tepidariorum]|uniref:uncharacterized protein n=1 Tax=Parasteatoda tepidariorum TaxID=114398 RepID=UPI00077FAD1B